MNQSTKGKWQVVLIPWMCLPASEMASHEKVSLVFETERCGFETLQVKHDVCLQKAHPKQHFFVRTV